MPMNPGLCSCVFKCHRHRRHRLNIHFHANKDWKFYTRHHLCVIFQACPRSLFERKSMQCSLVLNADSFFQHCNFFINWDDDPVKRPIKPDRWSDTAWRDILETSRRREIVSVCLEYIIVKACNYNSRSILPVDRSLIEVMPDASTS